MNVPMRARGAASNSTRRMGSPRTRGNGKPQWKEGTVRSAVSRAPFLRHVDNFGEVPDTKNACRRYLLKDA